MLTKYLAAAAGNSAEETQLFNAVTWSGTGSSQSITGVGFQPDFVWAKAYNQVTGHSAYDVIRGANKVIYPSATSAESDRSGVGGSLTSFDSDGFSVGTDSGTTTGLSNSGYNYVGWCWKAGGTASSNTDGAITSSVSANVAGGFSVVSWTATNSSSNVGHGLTTAPELIISKSRTSTSSWQVYTTAIDGSLDYIFLNNTNAKANSGLSSPTSSVFSVNHTEGAGTNVGSNNYIAYCFHSVDGLIDIGTYTGNGTTKTVTTGFQPAIVLAKRTDTTGNWTIADDARVTSGSSHFLYPNLTNVQSVNTVTTMTSTGFELSGSGGDYNASGGTYLYIAIKGVD